MKTYLPILALAALSVHPLYAETAEELLTTGIDCAYGRNGRAKNEAKALEYYLKASDKGSAEASYRAARMYFYGIGTPEDKAQSLHYYTLAAQSGHAKAAQELKKNFKGATIPAPSQGKTLAPDSAKGKVLVLDYSKAKVREYSHSAKSFGKEKAWSGDRSITWEFDKSTTPTFESGERITYTKQGDTSATVTVEGWESYSTYTLHFDTPTSGTATEETTAEADVWQARGISFKLENAPAD